LSADPESAERFVLAGSMKDGKTHWKKSFASETHPLHKFSSYASSTPCVDAQHVYVVWGAPKSVTMKAFTHDGQEVWTRQFQRYVSQHGFGTSPMLVGDLVVFVNSQDALELPEGVEPGNDRIIALKASTGELAWETSLTTTRVCYGVPCVMKDNKGKNVLMCANTGDGFFAIDALTGETLWRKAAFTKRICSSAVVDGNLVLSTEGSGGGGNVLVAMKNDGSGEEAFRITRSAPYVPTPVIRDGLAYLWADNGIVTCISLPDGQVVWAERIGGNISTSPIILGDRVVGISQEGKLTVLATGRTFKSLGSVDLGDIVRATPAATENQLLIRTDRKLLCIGP
jgi:outer membrane protein assembly factor BamB